MKQTTIEVGLEDVVWDVKLQVLSKGNLVSQLTHYDLESRKGVNFILLYLCMC